MPSLYDAAKQITLAECGCVGARVDAIVLDCEQGTQPWFAARLGRITASKVSSLVTATGQVSKGVGRRSFLCELAAERITGSVETHFVTAAMERGTALEPMARDWYSLTTGRDVRRVGFVYHDAERRWGCSPDGLCSDRVLEIKCLGRKNHVAALLAGGVPTDYVQQVQFQMWVCGLGLCDFVLFSDEHNMPSRVITVEADEKMHATFAEVLPAACDEIEAIVKQIKEGAE
jgi:putative phage-type endonuclease